MQAQREIPSKSKTKLHPVPRLATSQASCTLELRGAFNFVNIANTYVDSSKCSYYKNEFKDYRGGVRGSLSPGGGHSVPVYRPLGGH